VALNDVPGAHGVENRLQAVVERQHVGQAAARGERQYGFSSKGELRQRIQEGFQNP
jgi:hypothetical protein